MPFNFDKYAEWCREWDDDVLQEEYQKYVKLTSRGSTGAAAASVLAFFTGGISLIGAVASWATMANAAGKVQVIKEEMARRKKKHKLYTRPQDVFGGIAWGSTGLITTPIEHMVGTAISSGATSYHGLTYIPSHDYISREER